MIRGLRAAAMSLLLGACTSSPVRPVVTPTVREAPVAAAAPRRGRARDASASELRVVEQLMHETEQLRGLRFQAAVRVTIEDRAAMRRYVERAIDDAQLARTTQRYLALGAIDPSTDVRALLVDVMDEELIGYYDPKEKRLSVREDIASALGDPRTRDARSLTWRATVVHELVHALQDQYFDLGSAMEQQRTTDADNAFGALVEGDATLAMLGYTANQAGSSLDALIQHPEEILSAMTRTPDQLTGALRRAPALLREPLLFRYREGAHFCGALFRRGGWAEVDRAERAPPEATTQIRDPGRYVRGEPVPTLAAPDVQAWLTGEHTQRDEDVLGALELSVLLEPTLGRANTNAAQLVRGWRGDHYVVLESQGTLASVWWLRFASAAYARKVALAFEQLGDRQRRVMRQGALVLVTRNLDDDVQASVQAWFVRASALPPHDDDVHTDATTR